MHVIGTAGHVDHGKSTLVRALTGIDPDRLKEEKEREMTIDLGFAWMPLPSGEMVGIVDVPGHIDFIKNMLAGVGGIDAAVLVIAADEGVMPQTREHLAILDLLAVPAGVIALTKIDVVDEPEWVELVTEDVRQVVAGTCLANAPIIPCSARTGEGIESLRAAIAEILARTPARQDLGRPRLPVDRVFSLSGFGTIVTGTLIDGSLQTGQEVIIVPGPGGEPLRGRIRGLQSYHRQTERALPGSRVAVNLSGVSKGDIARGMVVTVPGAVTVTRLMDARVRMLADAPFPLRHNQPVAVFVGSAEAQARTRLLDAEEISPGGEGWVQFHLQNPIAVRPGDRFILRLLSPSYTLGGGVIVDASPRRWRRHRPEVIRRLEMLAHGSPADQMLHALEQAGLVTVGEAVQKSSLPATTAREALRELAKAQQIRGLSGEPVRPDDDGQWIVAAGRWAALMEHLVAVLREYHRTHPFRRGMPRQELKGRLEPVTGPLSTRVFNEIMAQAQQLGRVREDAGIVAEASFQITLTDEQRRAADALIASFQASPYTPPSYADAVQQVGEPIVQALLELGELVRLNDDVLFLRSTYEEMVEQVAAYIEREGEITVAQARDLFRTSRKYALALMEYLDAQRITVRVGDVRRLRRGWRKEVDG